jgi:hypothetical protein
MPAPTCEEFWNLLLRSRLVDADTAAGLRAAHDAAGGAADAKATALWLVKRGVLTRWQARRLAIGDLGPFFLGEYRLLERHDRPGEALLFSARHEPSGQGMSLVLLPAKRCRELDVWTAIVRRTTAAHQATDPTLSRTWALEQAAGSRFIVCETVGGTSLADELERLGPVPLPEAGRLVAQVARAVSELHALGAVHGALSLDALLREPEPPGAPARSGRVRLLQFPLADDPLRVTLRAPVATAAEVAALGRRSAFVAPELLLPDAVCDARSDVYAIGCILHALLAGRPPCWDGDPQATLRQAAFAGVPPLGPPVPSELSALVAFMTARDPAARYQSAGQAADAIAACCGLESGPAAPVAAARIDPLAADAGGLPAPMGGAASDQGWAARLAGRRPGRGWLIGGAVGLVMLGLVASSCGWFGAGSRSSDPQSPPVDAEPSPAPTPPPALPVPPAEEDRAAAAAVVERQIVVDDPALPWASPTSGSPPRLAFLPAGVQLVLLARPAAALADDEGRLFLQALGPAAAAAAERLAALGGCALADVELLQAGWQASDAGDVLDSYVLQLVPSRRVPKDEAARLAAWGRTTAVDLDGETMSEGSGLSFWVPESEGGRTLVAAPAPLLREIVIAASAQADGPAASLPKETETLVGMLDADRHLTLFGSPQYLVHDGRRLLAGPLARLADPLAAFFGDSMRAAAVSVHFGPSAYAELDVVATAATPASRLARTLAASMVDVAAAVEGHDAILAPADYGSRVVKRLPQMIRALAANLRAGVEGKAVVVNAYLPRHATHNLALAAELALAQSPGRAAPGPRPGAATAQDALGRLQKKMTLVFAKDTLEKSIQLIADEIGVPMEILGTDLQLEGITKNQSFALDETDKTAEEILRAILAKANPDGKLVFVVRKQDGIETIEITTRAAVEKRGDTLPSGR